jgi:hypothetical protein
MNISSRITAGDISSLLGVNAIREGLAEIFFFAEEDSRDGQKIQRTHYELCLDDGSGYDEDETKEEPFNEHKRFNNLVN